MRPALLSLGVLLATVPTRAETEAAPGQATRAAHAIAAEALRTTVQALPAKEREKLPGIYVAFAREASDPLALAACDDDGDYVVLLSDAMLALVDGAARAIAEDELLGTSALRDYGALLAAEQRPHERLIPLPPGPPQVAHVAKELSERQEGHFRSMLTLLVAQEMAHVLGGDLVCSHPSSTHEAGDDTWSPQEHEAALLASAGHGDPRRVLVADVAGTGYALDAGAREEPFAELLATLVDPVERSPRALAAFGYARAHARARVRAQVVRAAAAAARARGRAGGPAP